MSRIFTRRVTTFVVLCLALFVFLFALNAKLSLCYPTGPEHSRTALKLYLNGQKLTIRGAIEGQGLLLSGIVTAIFFAVCSSRVSVKYHVNLLQPIVPSTHFFSLPRFFRPPPALL